LGERGAIAGSYSTSGGPAAFLLTWASDLGQGQARLAAASLGLSGESGSFSLPVDSAELRFGANQLTLQLEDAKGRKSAAASFGIQLAGAGGSGVAPRLDIVSPASLTIARPIGPSDRVEIRLVLSYADEDGDLARLRWTMARPGAAAAGAEFPASALGIAGTQGTATLSLFALRSTDPAGAYPIDVVLFDAGGRASAPARATLLVTVDPAAATPFSISGFDPAQGSAGDVVGISGTGFSATTRVFLGGSQAEVLSQTADSLSVVVPADAGSAPFRALEGTAVAFSASAFTVPGAVRVDPAAAEVAAGARVPLRATVVSRPAGPLVFSVNGAPGGDATVGTVGSDGVYLAPAEVPPAPVVVRAALASDGSVFGEARITVVAPPAPRGVGRVLPSAGGTVVSADGTAELVVPPGAVSAPADLGIAVLRGAAVPAAPEGRRALGAVQLGPSGMRFASPVSVTVPLLRSLPPGTALAARSFDDSGALGPDEGLIAMVGALGNRATVQVTHFSGVMVNGPSPDLAGPLPACSQPAVTIASAEPAFGQEGRSVPVRILGSGLTPDLGVRVLREGQDTLDILPDALFGLDTRAGVLLRIQPIPDLPAGQSRPYTLRLERPGGCVFAETTFQVEGLDELIVEPGQSLLLDSSDFAGPQNLPGQPLFSTVLIGGQVVVPGFASKPSPRFVVAATGPIVVSGSIVARGEDGQSASGSTPGAGGEGGGNGGRGEADGNAPQSGTDGAFWWIGHEAHGIGGRHGHAPDIGDLVNLILHGVGCALSGGLDVYDCVAVVVDAVQLVQAGGLTQELAEAGYGAGKVHVNDDGTSAGGVGAGGGGGGGAAAKGCGPEDILSNCSTIPGGGGGGGGGPGRTVALRSGDAVVLGSSALIDASGGNGGDGAILRHDVTDLITGARIADGFPGGGGGGGNGGGVSLSAPRLVSVPSPVDQVRGAPGRGGLGGVERIDVATSTGVVRMSYVFDVGKGGDGQVGGSLDTLLPLLIGPDPAFGGRRLGTMVTDRTLFRLPAGPGEIFTITTENGPKSFTAHPSADRPGLYDIDVVLDQGFNYFGSGGPGGHGDVALDVRILVVAQDSDGDGLSDADEALIGTDSHNPDTDGDGLGDGAELLLGTDPLDGDADQDGLSDSRELAAGTDPHAADGDGDGIRDGLEIVLRTDPRDRASAPGSVPAGTWYETRGERDGVFLAAVDPATGTTGTVGRPNSGLGFGLAFSDSGLLFISRGTELSVANPLTAAVRDVATFSLAGSATAPTVGAIAFDPLQGVLFAVQITRVLGNPVPQTLQLLRIDPASGAATALGAPSSTPVLALAVDQSGRIFASLQAGAGASSLASVDRSSGAMTPIGSIGFPDVYGLSFDAGDALHGNTVAGDLLDIDAATGAGTARSRGGAFVRGLAILRSDATGPKPLHMSWTLSGGTTTCPAGASVHFFLDSRFGDSFDLGASPCDPGRVDLPLPALRNHNVDLHAALVSGSGALIEESFLINKFIDPAGTSFPFSFDFPLLGKTDATISWTLSDQFNPVSCADVGADTVEVFAAAENGRNGVISPLPLLGAFPCADGSGVLPGFPKGSVRVRGQLEGAGAILSYTGVFLTATDGASVALDFFQLVHPSGAGELDVRWTVNDQPASVGSCPIGSALLFQTSVPAGPARQQFGYADCTAGAARLGNALPGDTVLNIFLLSAPGFGYQSGEPTPFTTVVAGTTTPVQAPLYTVTGLTGGLTVTWTLNGQPASTACAAAGLANAMVDFRFGAFYLAQASCKSGRAQLGAPPGTATLTGEFVGGSPPSRPSAQVTVTAQQNTSVALDFQVP
jgi:hypothetical protein